MDNPFRYGEIVSGDFFTDREEELDSLVADAASGQNVVVISPRRYGKSSLVLRARERLIKGHALVAYVDLLKAATVHDFSSELASAVYNAASTPVRRLQQQVADIFATLPVRPKITVNPNGTWGVELTVPDRKPDADALLSSLLELPQTIARDRKRRVVLVLDEFQQVIELDTHLPALLRSIFQTQSEVAHIFLGSRQHLMQEVFTDRNQPLYRSAKPLPLGVIERTKFAAFIRERCKSSFVGIGHAAVERILDVTASHPHDTQELCYFAWSLASAGDGVITPAIVDGALERVTAAEDAHYTTLWESLTLAQRRVVLAIAREPRQPVFSDQFRRTHNLGAASSVSTALERLLDREVVDGSSVRGFEVPDVFFRAWLQHAAY
jgi:hypothetical protein